MHSQERSHMLLIKANIDNPNLTDCEFRNLVRTMTDMYGDPRMEIEKDRYEEDPEHYIGPYGCGVSQEDR